MLLSVFCNISGLFIHSLFFYHDVLLRSIMTYKDTKDTQVILVGHSQRKLEDPPVGCGHLYIDQHGQCTYRGMPEGMWSSSPCTWGQMGVFWPSDGQNLQAGINDQQLYMINFWVVGRNKTLAQGCHTFKDWRTWKSLHDLGTYFCGVFKKK